MALPLPPEPYPNGGAHRLAAMKLKREAAAGTSESSDLLVMVTPAMDGRLEVVVHTDAVKPFGRRIEHVVTDVLDELLVTEGIIVVRDRGAVDDVIRTRIEAAVRRSAGGRGRPERVSQRHAGHSPGLHPHLFDHT